MEWESTAQMDKAQNESAKKFTELLESRTGMIEIAAQAYLTATEDLFNAITGEDSGKEIFQLTRCYQAKKEELERWLKSKHDIEVIINNMKCFNLSYAEWNRNDSQYVDFRSNKK